MSSTTHPGIQSRRDLQKGCAGRERSHIIAAVPQHLREALAGGLVRVDDVDETAILARDVLGDAAHAPDLPLFVANGEDGIADPAHSPIGPDDAVLLDGDRTQRGPITRCSTWRSPPLAKAARAVSTPLAKSSGWIRS